MKVKFKNKDFEPDTLRLVSQLDEILTNFSERGFVLTVRQAYYKLVSRNIIQNNESEYKKISRVLTDARMAGLIDWNMIEDRTRYLRQVQHWSSPNEILNTCIRLYRINIRHNQPFYLECWIEKDALISLVEQVCHPLDVPCFSCRGNPSTTLLYETAKRFEGKNVVILYTGDHDPSGLNIPKSITEKLKTFGVEPTFKRIALTQEQIQYFNLPPAPIKESDKNSEKYIANTGEKFVWELDALPPEYLQQIFRDEIDKLTDFQQLKTMQEIEQKHKTELKNLITEVA